MDRKDKVRRLRNVQEKHERQMRWMRGRMRKEEKVKEWGSQGDGQSSDKTEQKQQVKWRKPNTKKWEAGAATTHTHTHRDKTKIKRPYLWWSPRHPTVTVGTSRAAWADRRSPRRPGPSTAAPCWRAPAQSDPAAGEPACGPGEARSCRACSHTHKLKAKTRKQQERDALHHCVWP